MIKALTCRVCIGLGAIWTFGIAIFITPFMWLSESFAHGTHRIWARGCLWLMGIHLKVENFEVVTAHKGGFVLAPNHSSMFDILIMASLPVNYKWISKKEVGQIPFVGWTMRALGAYFVRRDGTSRDVDVMKNVESGLRRGQVILIFPEGTRTRTGELLPLKKGPFRIAQNAGIPLIPVGISGAYQIAPPKKLPLKRGHLVTVRLGTPFYVDSGAELLDVMGVFRGELQDLIDGGQSQGGKPEKGEGH